MYKRVIFGEVANESVAQLEEVTNRETFILATLALVVLLFGVWPSPLTETMHASVQQLVTHIAISKVH